MTFVGHRSTLVNRGQTTFFHRKGEIKSQNKPLIFLTESVPDMDLNCIAKGAEGLLPLYWSRVL